MGYEISSFENNFKIKKENLGKSFIKLYNYTNENKNVVNNWKWVSCNDILNASSLSEILENFGLSVNFDNEGNINNIKFISEKLGNEFELFKLIAEFVENKSYIEVNGADGETWRWIFEDAICKEVYPNLTYSEDEIIVNKKEYDKLKKDSEFLECLKSCGVDNWVGYGDAQEMMENE